MRVAHSADPRRHRPAANLELVRDHARRAADGARLVVFPEATMCRFGFRWRRWPSPRRSMGRRGPGIAADAGVTVFAGMFTPSADGRVH